MADNEHPIPDRDYLEGRYTEADPETATLRTVHGQYTESGSHHGSDPLEQGHYTNVDGHKQDRGTSERAGKFTRTEEAKR